MPRTVKARSSYDADCGRLLQLSQAIDLDVAARDDFKQEAKDILYRLVMLLNEENQRRFRRRSKHG